MERLLVHVEGETEEAFVNNVLRVHLAARGYERIGARLLGNARQRDRRGGIRGWETVRNDIVKHLRQDEDSIQTMMVDYYGLPKLGRKAWPGRAEASAMPFPERGLCVQRALLADLARDADCRRFLPFVVMHEFEGLLFSDCAIFAESISRRGLAESLQEIRDRFETPEHINDSPVTSPSKRVVELFPGYQKPLFGAIAAEAIGLDSIRTQCPHFATWLGEVERLAQS